MAGALAIVVVLAVLFVAGAGYFGYSGNVIVERQSYDEVDTFQLKEDETLSENNSSEEESSVDRCTGIICENTTSLCPDSFRASCSNFCKDGECGKCIPDCKGHDFVTPRPNTSVASSPLKQSTLSPVSKSTPDIPASLPAPETQQQETQQSSSMPEPTQTPQMQIKQPKIISIKFDAEGDDRLKENWNTEWVEIDGQGVDMSEWTISDNSSHIFVFPDGFVIGRTIKIRSGNGENTQTDLYWNGGRRPIWNNNGDVAYLKDKDGNLIDQYSYENG